MLIELGLVLTTYFGSSILHRNLPKPLSYVTDGIAFSVISFIGLDIVMRASL